MEKVCPRCGGLFSCLHDHISECQCASVTLDALQRAYIEMNYADCLCKTCLKEIQTYFYAFDVNPRYRQNPLKTDVNLNV